MLSTSEFELQTLKYLFKNRPETLSSILGPFAVVQLFRGPFLILFLTFHVQILCKAIHDLMKSRSLRLHRCWWQILHISDKNIGTNTAGFYNLKSSSFLGTKWFSTSITIILWEYSKLETEMSNILFKLSCDILYLFLINWLDLWAIKWPM